MRTLLRRRAWPAAVALAILVASAGAQQRAVLKLATNAALNETYLDNPKVSGSLLVGVRWDGQDGQFDPDRMGVSLPSLTIPRTACVEVVSKDGRYTAEGLFAVPNVVAGQQRLGYETKYGKKLREYQSSDIGIIVRETAACGTAADGRIWPAAMTGTFDPGKLMIYVNADPERTRATIVEAEGGQERVLAPETGCDPPGPGVHIAYSAVCTLVFSEQPGPRDQTLRITVKERFKPFRATFTLRLAP